jgi:hypothetical protein
VRAGDNRALGSRVRRPSARVMNELIMFGQHPICALVSEPRDRRDCRTCIGVEVDAVNGFGGGVGISQVCLALAHGLEGGCSRRSRALELGVLAFGDDGREREPTPTARQEDVRNGVRERRVLQRSERARSRSSRSRPRAASTMRRR